ncbi:MAG TPA: UDP-N-acetylglucosamine 1-carboxyvinyltransferase [Clostridiaceae bacterium]
MDKLVINGGRPLNGKIQISGSKNAAVAILPAALMASSGECYIDNIPEIEDVRCLERILKSIGCIIETTDNSFRVNSTNIKSKKAVTEDVRKMRASYYLVGALLGRFKEAVVELPGGCAIGVRPIDQHIKGFQALGAKVLIEDGTMIVKADRLIGANIFFDVVSVGATINVMLASSLAEGTTTLENVAKEPHVVDVANFLNFMGADIKGAGTDLIRIKGVSSLHGCNYSVIPDQIEAATYMIASAACGGNVTIENIIPKHLESVTAKLLEMGIEIQEHEDSLTIKSDRDFKAVNIKTLPYPGIPTDIQQPMSALLSIAKGKSIISESIWDGRFKHVAELKKMGANINVEGLIATIEGTARLTGAVVIATDLRAGAAMVIAGLIADGTTEVLSIDHIDRGYLNIEEKFSSLGADIKRIHQ